MKAVHRLFCSIILLFVFSGLAAGSTPSAAPWSITQPQAQLLDKLQRDTFDFFWETTNPANGLTPDRYPDTTFASVAGVGFALSAYLVGAEKGYVSREEAARRTLATLRFLMDAPQNATRSDATGYRGFFYHFLQMDSGLRHDDVELSTIDTALLMAGVLSAQVYFDGDSETERRIRALGDALYRRVDWPWAYSEAHQPLLSMGWRPETGFIGAYWEGYNEAMILYILALGSPTHPIAATAWQRWTETYDWQGFYDLPHVNFGPLFGHQYSHTWIDFRNIQDAYMQSKGIDYFINSRRAVYASRAYCAQNPQRWTGYGDTLWGLTACNGPDRLTVDSNGQRRVFHRYLARGASAGYLVDDGTIAPTAVGGSVPFAPEVCIPTLTALCRQFGERLYGRYGLKDAFNLSYPNAPGGWFDKYYLAIDQGPILLMIENYRTGLVWDLMKQSPYIRRGLQRAGFSGGWLDARRAGE